MKRSRDLFAEPLVSDVAVAPDGRQVSQLRYGRLAHSILVRRLGHGADRVVLTSGQPIVGHAWLAGGAGIAYLVADSRTGRVRAFVLDLASGHRTQIGLDGADMYLLDPGEPRLTGPLLAVRQGTEPPRLYQLRGAEGRATALDLGQVVDRWFLDPDDNVRAGTCLRDDGTLRIYAYAEGGWNEVLAFPPPQAFAMHPIDVSASGDRLVVVGPTPAGPTGLFTVHLSTGERRTLVADDERSLDYALLHPRTRTPQLLVFSGSRAHYQAFDEAVDVGLAGLRRSHPGDPRIVARSVNDETWIARLDAPDAPPGYAAWHRVTGQCETLADPHPRLRRRRFSAAEAISFKARDGVRLDGYLTRPERPRRTPPPLVLVVHGGPWDQDSWEFVPEVQWLAGHGYCCLQLNFRGSEGRGAAFLDLANRDWGGAPQDDLEDAADWAVSAGYADPHQMGIVGRSYGGYAALIAATARPKRFACAAAVSAPTDLVDFVRHVRCSPLPARPVFVHRIGDPEQDREMLWQRSPIAHAHACHTPILLAHGCRDGLVPLSQVDRFAAALVAARRPVRRIMFPAEGHGIVAARARARLARAVTAHFAKYLDA